MKHTLPHHTLKPRIVISDDCLTASLMDTVRNAVLATFDVRMAHNNRQLERPEIQLPEEEPR